MRSLLFHTYGSIQDLSLGEKPIPQPGPHEVLVRIHAAGVNDWDWGLMRGQPFVNRLLFGLFKPRRLKTLGLDISGVVEAVGTEAKRFIPGDAVLGDLSASKWGGFAEYVAVDEKVLTRKPPFLSHEQGAALPHAGVLALQGFLDYNLDVAGKEVLINGGGGGSGTLAIQIAKHLGARVTAVDKKGKFEVMRKMGAERLIDYQQSDFTSEGKTYDFILDMAGHHPLAHYRRALKPGGRYLMVGGASGVIISCMTKGFFWSKTSDRTFGILTHEPNKYLPRLLEMMEEHQFEVTVGKTFPLEQTPEALAWFGKGEGVGKTVVTIS
ncbi:MAG: NAD(P)-dependent alcohol dehydrogenase [Bacteroidota bacterium]